MAQGAKVVAYFAPMTEHGWVDALTHIIADSDNDPSVLSISWWWRRTPMPARVPGLLNGQRWLTPR